jgi:hypothetical protein
LDPVPDPKDIERAKRKEKSPKDRKKSGIKNIISKDIGTGR